MRPRFRAILEECIEIGVEAGLNKAYKHTGMPSHDILATCLDNAIWLEIDQRFTFEPEVQIFPGDTYVMQEVKD